MPKRKHRRRTRQGAALVFRRDENGNPSVLVISSRETGRPVIPKGWPMIGKSDPKAAAIEAEEEAGVRGVVSKKSVGSYRYWKRLKDHFRLVRVDVYMLEARAMAERSKEDTARQAIWLTPEAAADIVDDPELATLILSVRFPKASKNKSA